MRRTTSGIYLLLFLVALGAYYYLSKREKPADIAITPGTEEVVSYLFKAEEGTPIGIRIESKDGAVVELTRGADEAWVLKQPAQASADQSAVEAAVSQLTTMRILDTLPKIDRDVVGLKTPAYTILLQFKDKVERKAEIGVITPTENGYYVLSPAGDVVIVSKSSVDALIGMLTNPPYSETPTPSPTETPLPPTLEDSTATPSTLTPQP